MNKSGSSRKFLLPLYILLNVGLLVGHYYISRYVVADCSWNDGFAFGVLNGAGDVGLILAIIALLVAAVLLTREKRWRPSMVFFLLGGLGNILDRLFFGAVCDYIDLSRIFPINFPIFNLNDAIITLNLIVILFGILFNAEDEDRSKKRKS